jgi:ABC-type Zn uptake system ZnuABC Zn-binding protein ZnuA
MMLPCPEMSRPYLVAALVAFTILVSPHISTSAEPLKVVATLPFLKEFAEQIGREHVDVRTLISGLESEHSYSPKPRDLKALRQASLLLEVGLGLEVWVGGLIKNADNPRLRVITTSKGVELLHDDPSAPSSGNPHIWLDPECAKLMLRHIADGLLETDPTHADEYRKNLAAYLSQIDQAEKVLQARVASLPDRRIVTHHPAWPYFARRFGFQIEDEIVRQTGAEASGAHLATMVRRMKERQIKVIVSEPQLNQRIPLALAAETGARVVILSPLPGTLRGTDTYLALLEYNVAQLVSALSS